MLVPRDAAGTPISRRLDPRQCREEIGQLARVPDKRREYCRMSMRRSSIALVREIVLVLVSATSTSGCHLEAVPSPGPVRRVTAQIPLHNLEVVAQIDAGMHVAYAR